MQIAVPALIAVGVALAWSDRGRAGRGAVAGRDPLGLSERGRTVYVYAAEGARGAVVPAHSRDDAVAVPRLVPAVLAAGRDGDRVCRRGAGRSVSATPAARAFRAAAQDGRAAAAVAGARLLVLSSQVHYSLLLLSIGVLYASLSVLRQSFLYGVLAAIAANGSLWYLLHDRARSELPRSPAAVADSAGAVGARRRLHQSRAAHARSNRRRCVTRRRL